MKQIKNPVILIFAIIGVCAVLFGVWHLYQERVAEDQAKTHFLDATPYGPA